MNKRLKKILALLLTAAMVFGSSVTALAQMTGNGTAAMSISFQTAFEEQAITYTRILCLKNSGNANGTLLMTCDQHSWVDGEQVWPIYRSTDNGNTWSHVSDVKDTVFGTNRKAQPMLFELPQAVGNLPKGTVLLAGNLVPNDQSSSRIVIYKSANQGSSWDYVSTVDTGGPFDYDPSPTSTTTTVWEPFLYMDAYGHLVCAYSDERQKANGVLQALSLRYTSDGTNWSELKNIVAVGNQNDRPGMVTVDQMPNGKYIATYEVVNKPSLSQNSSIVYYKTSDDGLAWNPSDVGTLLETEDGLCLGSSPYVKWVNAGGPNGMVIVGSKWAINKNGDIQEGGQNFFVNYNLGEGPWERYPQPLTWDAEGIQYLDAFSQCIGTNVDDTVLYESANILSPDGSGIDVRFGTLPLTYALYEAENANLTNAQTIECYDSSGGYEVGYINYSDSKVLFDKVVVPESGTYTVYVRYNNGTGGNSSHKVSVNGGSSSTVTYPATADWNRYQWASFNCPLNAGNNTIQLSFNGTYAELDCIMVGKAGTDLNRDFMIKNKNSGMYLETPSMGTADNAVLGQYSKTVYPCQLWEIKASGSGSTLMNRNSGKYCQIQNASMADGAKAVQYTYSGSPTQIWSFEEVSGGYFYIKNQNSQKLLEIAGNSTELGAEAGQWGDTGYDCQKWTLVKESTR
ncbi:RICIN domain-containing protein [Diplocloster agilis]|uniref:RICIN domain-containing protein n=1 Tax=Diplocloster agilis TaxID=2850323 RepID=UPI0008226112|nr:RICIN domain-containing protein [Suonthocola fibrivorans]MCU6734734.1 RICIN domain-containing protein [Suonthocola fibrivorans]SCJ52385.1 Carbohydrate binding module (family 6) [uncultured Clostridium sp.]